MTLRNAIQRLAQGFPIKSLLLPLIAAFFIWTSSQVSAFQGNPIQAGLDAAVGGETVNGVQLRLAPAVGAEQKAATDYLMRLSLQIRNGGQVPVTIDNSKISDQVEFEIDRVWYRESEPMSGTGLLTVPPGGQGQFLLTFLINNAYRYHGLNAVESNGAVARLNLKDGKHSIRIRTLPSAIQSSALQGISLVSNAITVDIPAIAVPPVAPSQSARKPDIASFRFAAGPSDGLDVVNDFLIHPSTNLLATIPKLADFDSLRVLPPIAFSEFSLPETPQTLSGGVPQGPAPSLPGRTDLYTYLVETEGKGIAAITVHVNTLGHAELWTPSTDTYETVRALTQLSAMERVRTGSYELRLLRVSGRGGSVPAAMLWLKSESGNSDLFYELPNPNPRFSSLFQLETLYTKEEFLNLAGTHSAPAKDAAWAIRTAMVCAANARSVGGSPLLFDKATALPWEGRVGALQWWVTIPEQSPRSMPNGAAFLVDETTGICTVASRE
jgi:hypothetical protein